MANILIDTNIFLDILLKREGADDNYTALAKILKNRDKPIVSASAMTDIYYVARRYFKSDEIARAAVSAVADMCRIVDTNRDDIINALSVDMPDYEDAVVACVAKRYNAECIITNNIKDFKNSPVKAVLSKEY